MSSAPLLVIFFIGWVQIFLYGCNVVLFGTSIFLLLRRGLNRSSAISFIFAIALLAQATALAVVETAMIISQLSQINDLLQLVQSILTGGIPKATSVQLELPPSLAHSSTSLTGGIDLHACNIFMFIGLQVLDLTTCFILVHRCYILYNRNWKILVGPMIIILADIGVYGAALPVLLEFPYAAIEDVVSLNNPKLLRFSTAVIVLNAFANGSLTLLIAGKIWMIRRRTRQYTRRVGAPAVHQKYSTLIAMTLESGLIIPVSLIILEIFVHVDNTVGAGIMGACLPQIMALAPLLIMVRVGLGLTVRVEASHGTMQAETTATGHEVELQMSRPLAMAISVTTSQTVSVSSSPGAPAKHHDEPNHPGSEPDLDDSDSNAKQFGYAV
ncbi:hypothetical protein WG66_004434 [Moniliophthora roreri]|uniref:Integral membrane protein n=1 Tax=Moniliophthora roreri TaxID=221103 RepID=A0A0W0FKE7_MONRR|nr:hypothetical protein WG66_004434 [Moniliophthora roreri]